MTWPSLTALAVYTLAAFGLAWVVGHAKVSLRPREWLAERGRVGVFVVELLECPGCFSVWSGGLAGTLLAPHLGYPGWRGRLLVSFVLSFYTAGANVVLASVTGLVSASNTDNDEIIK